MPKMVDFSDITDEDIQKQWELLCAREKHRFNKFARKHPVWDGCPVKLAFESVEAYKQHLYESIQQYEAGVLLLFDDAHEVMQKLHDNLKNHTL